MRDNGLTAAAYTSMGGIDPLVTEPVLAALAEAGIAAYCAPRSDDAPKIPAGHEEIWVDSASVDAARAVIDRSTEDAEWNALVEQFKAPSAPGHEIATVPRWPASEDVDESPAGSTVDREPLEEPVEEPRAKRRDDDPHDHFVPPEPPRGPRLDWISRLAWLCLLGGPLLLILAAVFDFGTGRTQLLGVAGFIAGFLTLVLRMKDRLPPDDTPDGGAVV